MRAVLQVREKEDRHQQQKIRGFLQPVEDIQAARAAAAGADMEVGDYTFRPCDFGALQAETQVLSLAHD